MHTSNWELDPERNPPKPILTGRERNYLLTGETDPYGESKFTRDVSDKADMLTERVQDLIDDICLLYLGEHLEGSEGEHVFNVSDLEFRTQLVRDQETVRIDQESTESASEFAFEVGSLLKMLEVGSDPADIIWGVLIGLVGHPKSRFTNELDTVERILRKLENRHQERLFHVGATLALDGRDGDSELRETANNILRKEGITPVPILVDAIVQYQINPASEPLGLQMDSYTRDTSQRGPPKQPSGEISVKEWDETDIRSLVQMLLEETRLRDIEVLCVDLRSDIRQVNDRMQFGTHAKDLFRNMSLDGSTGSFPSSTYSSHEMRTAVLNRLSGQEESPLWTTRPVIEESGDDNWKLTPYGRLLYRTIFDSDGSTSWIYHVLLAENSMSAEDESLVGDVLDEWNS